MQIHTFFRKTISGAIPGNLARPQPAVVKKFQNPPNYKNSVALLKTTSVKKVVRSNGGQKMAAMVKVDGKNFNGKHMNFVLISSEAGMREHK